MKRENKTCKIFFKGEKFLVVVFFTISIFLLSLCLKEELSYGGIDSLLEPGEMILGEDIEKSSYCYGEFENSGPEKELSKNNLEGDAVYSMIAGSENKNNRDTNSNEKTLLLEIPKIRVSAEIQQVGLNSKKEMEVPSNDWDVAWYKLGPKPGEPGSAVLAGHLNSKTGQPAVFWELDEMEEGDFIYVVDGSEKKTFRVNLIARYKTETAPLEKIFGANDGIYLNLITCGGLWDGVKNNYTERLVVFSEYVFSEE